MPSQINRRNMLQTALAAHAVGGAQAAGSKHVTIGMATLEFRELTNSAVAKELAGEGVRTIQLFLTQSDSNYWKYNSRSDLKGLTPERCREIAGAYRSAGVSIHSIGVYTNLIHPDAAERKANLAYFEAMFKAGAAMGVRKFVTEAGHYYSDAPAPRIPHDWQEEVWRAMVATGKELARMAAAHDATVLFEPYFQGFLATAKRTRIFLEELGSPRMRALLDPANLLEVNDLEEMFNQLQPWIDCLHAKDRKLHVTKGVGAGAGDLDYPAFVKLAAERTPGVPLILEYVGSKNWRPALAHLRNALRQSGLREG